MFNPTEYKKEYYKKNKAKLNAKSKENYAENKDKYTIDNKEWAKNHPEKVNEIKAKYRDTHREELREKGRKYQNINRYTPKGRYNTYKDGAKKRGLVFEITLKEFEDMINSKCCYCGDAGYGVDRIDNSIGYLRTNVVACCSICNRMKFVHSVEDFINHCNKIINNYGK